MTFDPAAIAAFKADALARWPEEACGLITADGYAPCANTAAEPVIDFSIDPAEWITHGEVLAVLHSHTHSRDKEGALKAKPIDAPSYADQRAQPATGVPWGIACVTKSAGAEDADHCTEPFWFGDEVEPLPLIGRPFRWGVTDCFSLARDWWQQRATLLPNVPREHGWDVTGANWFVDNFAAVGFHPIREDETRAGDCCLMRVLAEVPNHCAVYLGDGTILHHLAGRLSRREPVSAWHRQITHWLRHESLS